MTDEPRENAHFPSLGRWAFSLSGLKYCLRSGGHDRRRDGISLPDTCQARRAIDRIAIARNERHSGDLFALGTRDFGLGPVWQTKLRFASGSAMRAPGRYVDKFLFPEEVLFAGRPGKRLTAVATRQGLVSKLHEKPLHTSGTRRAPPRLSSRPWISSLNLWPGTSSTNRFLFTVAPQ